jgi:branched-chain amino acid transport system substrate-binding protein
LRLEEETLREKGHGSRWLWIFAAVALLAIGASACGDDDSTSGTSAKGFTDAGYKAAGLDKAKPVTVDKDAPVKIGISSALSGDVKGLGVPIADSAETAGEGLTIKGHKIQFVREDDLCSAEGGPAAADRLLKANVIAVVGPICSGGTRASQAAYDKAGITHISPSATAGDLSSPPSRAEGPYVTFFRVPVLNADEAKAQAKFAKDTLKASKAFVVFDTDDYGKDLSEQFQTAFKAGGGQIVGTPTGYEKKATDFKAIISNIKAAKPDVVYLSGFYAEATPFLQQLRAEADLKTVPFISGDGVKNDDFISGAKAAAEGAYLALPGTQGSEYGTYKTKYKAKFNGDADAATFGAEAYDCATALIKAIEKAATDNGGKLTIDLKKVNEEVKKSDFAGASGQVKFGSDGNRSGAVVKFFQVKDGKYVDVTPK